MYTSKRNYGFNEHTFGNLLENVFQNGFATIQHDLNATMPVNIRENEKEYELQLFAPGIKKEDFKIVVDKNTLQVSYEHKEENTGSENNKWIRREYHVRSFKKNFTLHDKLDATNIAARYNDGILTIVLPKKENTATAVHEVAVN